MEEQLLKQILAELSRSLTNTKALVITDTVARTNVDAYAIYAITDTVFTTFNTAVDPNSNTLIGTTLPAGHTWFLPIKGTVTLASGKVIIYQNKNKNN